MSSSPPQVLIVEHEPVCAAAISEALQRRGLTTQVAANAQEALALARPNVFVVDTQLDGVDGLDVAQDLTTRSPSSRLVLISSTPTLSACRRAMQLGASDFLQKPLRVHDLVEAVEDCLRAQQSSQQSTRREVKRESTFVRTYSASARIAEQAVRDLLGYCLRCCVGPATRARIGTAIAEVVSNTCRHAYGPLAGDLELSASFADNRLRVVVRDRGCGFDVTSVLPAQSPEGCRRGLQRIRALAEGVVIHSQLGEGTTVQVQFDCYRVDFDDGRKIDLSDLDYLPPPLAKGVLTKLNESQGDQIFHLSPATAVTIGRLLAGPSVGSLSGGEALR